MKEKLSRRAFLKVLPHAAAGALSGGIIAEGNQLQRNNNQFKMEQRWGKTEARVIGLEWRIDGLTQIVKNHEAALNDDRKRT